MLIKSADDTSDLLEALARAAQGAQFFRDCAECGTSDAFWSNSATRD